MCGILIDFQAYTECPNGWKWVATLQLSRNDGFLSGVDHLFIQGHAGLKSKPERNHYRTITDITQAVNETKSEPPLCA